MSDQVQKFLDKGTELQQKTESHHDRPYDPNGPQVVFPSPALTLTKEQEDLLVTTALRRKTEIETEMGINQLEEIPLNANQFVQLRNKWMPKRELCDKLYEGDVEWRERAFGKESIFRQHNINLPMTRKIVQQQYSRAQNYFFDTEPWFSARPLRQIDPEIAENHEFFLKFKAKRSRLKSCFNNALKRAFINGEAVLKGTLQIDDDIYEDIATVAIDPESGEPLLSQGDMDYIFKDDRWIPIQNQETGVYLDEGMSPMGFWTVQIEGGKQVFPAAEVPSMEAVAMLLAQENIQVTPEDISYGLGEKEKPVMVLERDPATIMPEIELVFSEELIRRQIIHYEGADLDLVHWQDFLCPLQAKSIEDADCVVHLYDASVVDIVQKYMTATEGNAIADPRFLEMVNNMAGADASPKSRSGQRNRDDEDLNSGEPVIQIGEFYMTIGLGDGIQKNIMLVMDLDNEKPIFYDYVARITADGRRPFRTLVLNPQENRWYGSSQVGLFWGLQELLDLTMNRLNKSQSDSGRIDVFQSEAFFECDNDPGLKINDNSTLTLKPGFNLKEAIATVYLSDIKHDILMNLMQTIQQFAMSLGGVSSSNDADMAGMDTAKLATGIRHMERVGQEMFGPLIDDLIPGIQAATEMFFKITVANLEGDEDYEYFKDGEHQFGTIKPDEIRNLDYTIEVELTTYRGEQMLAQHQGAIEAVEKYYSQPYPVQVVTQKLFQKILKIYQIQDAESMIEPTDPMMPPNQMKLPGEEALPRQNRSEPNL